MMHSFLALGLAALTLGSLNVGGQSAPPRATDTRNQTVYVSVLGPKDVPVTGLAAADFEVKEDGVTREVLKAEPATDPMQIVLIVDDSQAARHALQPLREGLAAFVDKLKGRAEIGIVTVGDRATSLVPSTTDTAALKKGITRIFDRTAAGAYLLDGVMDVSKGFTRRKAARPVIVAVTMDRVESQEGVEFSNLHYENVLKQLEASGAALHVLSVGTPSSSLADEMRNRNLVIAEGTARTGGRRDQVLAPSGLTEAVPRVADELLNQYQVTYARPETLIPPEKLLVTVSRPGVTVRARTRVAGR
jgi:VWFA-related protein